MYSDVNCSKRGLPTTQDEKSLALPTINPNEVPLTQRASLLSRILNHRPNSNQKRLLAYGAAYITVFLTLKAWSATRHDGPVLPSDNAFAHDSYLNGLIGHGWSFSSMQERVEQLSIEQGGSFFSQVLEHDKHHKGDHHGHRGHRHHRPPFRHVTPQEAEEIFFKVPSNDSAAA